MTMIPWGKTLAELGYHLGTESLPCGSLLKTAKATILIGDTDNNSTKYGISDAGCGCCAGGMIDADEIIEAYALLLGIDGETLPVTTCAAAGAEYSELRCARSPKHDGLHKAVATDGTVHEWGTEEKS